MNHLSTFWKQAGLRAIGNETKRILAEANRRKKLSPATQRNTNRLASLLKPEAEASKRREQLNRALSK
jgi:hypothetical protein